MSKKLFWLFTLPLLAVLVCVKPAWGQSQILDAMKGTTAYEQGLNYYLGRGVPQDSQRAAAFFEHAAKTQNHPGAQFNLGVLYEHGEGVQKDLNAAVQWYEKAAQQNNAKAQYNLGFLLLEGFGISKNPVTGLQWLEKAADQGSIPAAYQLGCAYLGAKGVPHNRALALEWLGRAAAHDHKDAQQVLALAQSMAP
ncbi:MAG: sel1 repeat family protein [Gammaproteobacteria bacterium]|nr:sel1 repeat family protein [Gammaproteobacteria bacterium]MBP9728867.1 sel1 repeat family protein [Gammaproteobacteria bacterium]